MSIKNSIMTPMSTPMAVVMESVRINHEITTHSIAQTPKLMLYFDITSA